MTSPENTKESFSLEVSKETGSEKKEQAGIQTFLGCLSGHRLPSKFMFILTVAATIFLSYSTLSAPWFVPYIYTIVTPLLLFIRLILYWKLKYQYFLLDFCYFANIYLYTYMWAFPDNENMFIVGYAIATGPLLWSMLVFRNSYVLHDLDKITSMYIHTLPPLLVFVIRWYPEETGLFWYKSFIHTGHEAFFSVEWLIFIPFSFPVLHQIAYSIFVYGVMKPTDDYLYTFNYLVSDKTSRKYRICNVLGPRYQHIVFGVVWLMIILVMLIFNLIWYNYFAGHCAVLIFFLTVAVYNGARFYIDVFSHRLKDKEQTSMPETNCNSCEKISEGVKVYTTVVKLPSESNGLLKPV